MRVGKLEQPVPKGLNLWKILGNCGGGPPPAYERERMPRAEALRFAQAELQRRQARGPSSLPALEYYGDWQRAAVPRQRELSLQDINLKYFPTHDPNMDVLSYLTLFETTCEEMAVPYRYYMPILRSLVKGPLQELMGTLSREQMFSYETYKQLVEQRFSLDSQHYQQAFRKAVKVPPQEKFQLFAAKLEQNFGLWLAAEKVQTFEQLRQLVLLEQFQRSLPSEIASLVADRHPQNLQESARLAEEFRSHRAHMAQKPPMGGGGTRTGSPGPASSGMALKATAQLKPADSKPAFGKRGASPGRGKEKVAPSSGLCFLCHGKGHIKAQCPLQSARRSPIATSTPAVRQIAQPGEDWDEEIRRAGIQERAEERGPELGRGRGMERPQGAAPTPPPAAAAPQAARSSGSPAPSPPETSAEWAKKHFMAPIRINNIRVSSYRDTGADVTSVSKGLVRPGQVQPQPLKITPFGTESIYRPTAIVEVEYQGYSGNQLVILHEPQDCHVAALVGNDLAFLAHKHRQFSSDPAADPPIGATWKEEEEETPSPVGIYVPMEGGDCFAMGSLEKPSLEGEEGGRDIVPLSSATAVSAPSNVERGNSPLPCSSAEEELETAELGDTARLVKEQQEDPTLQSCREAAGVTPRGERRARFLYKEGLLFRQYWPKRVTDRDSILQLVVPGIRREKVLSMAHSGGLSGHLGVQKSLERLTRYFYWPQVYQSVQQYVRCCDVCQRVGHNRDSPPHTLQSIPLTAGVFAKWAIDFVGPLPRTPRGKKYIATIVDYATRYCFAASLTNTRAPGLVQFLFTAFCSMGIPQVLMSDLGPNLLSDVVQQVLKLMEIHHHTSVAYEHRMNGLVERVQSTLTSMLKKCALIHASSWDQDLPLVVATYNDSYQASLGYAPNQLVYGRLLNSPLSMLRKQWDQSEDSLQLPSVAEHFQALTQTLAEIWDQAKANLEEARKEYTRTHDVKAVEKCFEVGDKVLVLRPTRPHKLSPKWSGPGVVKERLSSVRYVVECPELHPSPRQYHANSMKLYCEPDSKRVLAIAGGHGGESHLPLDLLQEFKQAGSLEDILRSHTLNAQQAQELYEVLLPFESVFSTKPGRTHLAQHHFETGTAAPIASRPYRVSEAHAQCIEAEIKAEFQVQTDHSPLCWLSRMKNSNQKLLRWSLALQDYNFTVVHIPGKQNVVADALSRLYQSVE
ncbi:uncharacterized protein LOC132592754 [Zootoca vivipara]|uniref:uncharacterized protein LOC132592754 n=1 Tax=Zootoca vivipara TaxID=8524 RepID=UPI00293BE28E|nr:uncharacterized protein LOC132592754 [Zootoca vivipara]